MKQNTLETIDLQVISTSYSNESDDMCEKTQASSPNSHNELSLNTSTIEQNLKEDKDIDQFQISGEHQKATPTIKISRRKQKILDALANYCQQNGLLPKEKVKSSTYQKFSFDKAFIEGQVSDESCSDLCNQQCYIF